MEDQTNLTLGFPDVLVQELGPFDIQEIAAGIGIAGHLGDLLGQRIGHRLGDERLPAAGRAVEQNPLGCRQLVLSKQLAVEIGKLDGIGDRLDLGVESADIGIGDVGHLLEDEFLDFRTGELLHQQTGTGLHQDGIPGAEFHPDECVGELDHPLFVGAAVDKGAASALEQFFQHHHFTRPFALPGQDHIE